MATSGPVVFLTGAGVSAESNIPTFRGEEGYWRSGSKNYHPQELATRQAFGLIPEVVWSWYLWRLAVCRAAQPNAAHHAIAQAAAVLGERVLLITQNVDGLHRRAGSPPSGTYEVHGNIAWMRCSRSCSGLVPVPTLAAHPRELSELSVEERAALVCPRCAARARPHVLWFDETYDEPLFRFESSLQAASEAALLVVVGTTGTTNLPLQIGRLAVARGIPIVVINPEPNPFSEMAERLPYGVFLQGTAGQWMPEVLDVMTRGNIETS
jgi:NAD-dependent deacetylase